MLSHPLTQTLLTIAAYVLLVVLAYAVTKRSH